MSREYRESEMKSLISNKEVEFVQVELADTNGCSRGMLMNASYFLKNYQKGFGKPLSVLTMTPAGGYIDGAGYGGNIGYRNGGLIPDLSTFTVLPWLEKTASVLVDFHEEEKADSPLHPASSRNICKKQVNELKALGFQLYSAFEYEFYVLNPETKMYPEKSENFLSTQNNNRFASLGKDIMRNLDEIGIQSEYFHTEDGPSQLECPIGPSMGITGSDNAFRYKQLIKEMASKHGYMATFMAKPFKDLSGSGGHFNHSLWNADGENIFFDADCKYGLSKLAQHWLAGLRYHSASLLCFMCPTPNCIRRTNAAGVLAPINDSWGLDNRSVAYRIKETDSNNIYLEQRLASAAANPYLVTAGCIVAGMDGIKRELILEGEPCEGDISKLPVLPDHVTTLPKTLSESIDCLENNNVFVEAFGHEFIKLYSTMKKYEEGIAEKHKSDEFQWYMDYYGEYI